jgi:DNA-binding NarL/FixJ family response regulator
MKRPRVLLADDHEIVLDGLRRILSADFDVAASTNSGTELERLGKELQYDVVVADISMPGMNGIEATRRILKARPEARILILTMHTDVAYAIEAFKAGASGYLLKNSAAGELVTAIGEVLKGRTYVSPLIAKDVMELVLHPQKDQRRPGFPLSVRQREVLSQIAQGRSAKEIARALNISPRTVEFHKYRIMTELGLKTTAELVQFAIKNDLVG